MPDDLPQIWTYDDERTELMDLSECIEDLEDWDGTDSDGKWFVCPAVAADSAQPNGVHIEFPDVDKDTICKLNLKFLRLN